MAAAALAVPDGAGESLRISGGEDVLCAARSIEKLRAAEGSVSSFERSYGGGGSQHHPRAMAPRPAALPYAQSSYAYFPNAPASATNHQQQQTKTTANGANGPQRRGPGLTGSVPTADASTAWQQQH